MSNEMVELPLTVIHETNAAYLITDGDMRCWLPKSQIEFQESIINIGDTIEFWIPEWLAQDKGLI